MDAVLGLVDEAVLFALFSFGVQLFLMLLRSGSSVQVRIVPSPSQSQVFNYEVRNVGDVAAEDVRVSFSRRAEAQPELWNTEEKRDLHFPTLAPGEVWTSMFCLPSRWGDRKPVTATVRFKSGRLFRRLMDIDGDERWWWRVLGSPRTGIRRRKKFVLDPTRLLALRANIGYAGKNELEEIARELEKTRLAQERQATEANPMRMFSSESRDDWVAALLDCRAERQFDLLRERVESDVATWTRSAVLEIAEFTSRTAGEFEVRVRGGSRQSDEESVKFRLDFEGFIKIVEYRVGGPRSFTAHPVMEDGRCRFRVGDERLTLSEVSRRALQPLLFPLQLGPDSTESA